MIPVYIRLPTMASNHPPTNTTTLLTEPDQCRVDYSWAMHKALRCGLGCVILEMPGTGDSPADATDPQSLSRLWLSLNAWMHRQAIFDMTRLCLWCPHTRNRPSFDSLVIPNPTLDVSPMMPKRADPAITASPCGIVGKVLE